MIFNLTAFEKTNRVRLGKSRWEIKAGEKVMRQEENKQKGGREQNQGGGV